MTVACSHVCWLFPMAPLLAASTPSEDTAVCPYQDADPPVVNVRDVLSSAAASEMVGWGDEDPNVRFTPHLLPSLPNG